MQEGVALNTPRCGAEGFTALQYAVALGQSNVVSELLPHLSVADIIVEVCLLQALL